MKNRTENCVTVSGSSSAYHTSLEHDVKSTSTSQCSNAPENKEASEQSVLVNNLRRGLQISLYSIAVPTNKVHQEEEPVETRSYNG